MQELEAQRDRLHTLLAETVSSTELAEHGRLLKLVEQQLPGLEMHWLNLTGQLEEAMLDR